MLAVFDLPEWSTGADDHLVPELVAEHVLAEGPQTPVVRAGGAVS
jgi:hypothetical protein